MIVAILLVACAGESAATGSRTGTQWATVANLEPDARDITVSDQMWHHFADAAKVRDGVIFGDLAATRSPLNRLAGGHYGAQTPDAWAHPLSQMRAEAAKGALATDLVGVAGVVATLAGQCGQCHLQQGQGPNLGGNKAGYRPHGREGLPEAMARHVFAAEELWLGMTIPDDANWLRGAEALARTEVPAIAKPEETSAASDGAAASGSEAQPASAAAPATLNPELQRAIEDIRVLGGEAVAATADGARQQLYATLIARCGTCHAKLGIGPPRRP